MSKRTIKLKKYLDIHVEGVAMEAITPGHLIEMHTDGKFKKHATNGGFVFPMFALEDELQGKGITEDYATDDIVQAWIPQRGEEVYAILKNGETAVIGSKLESGGDGTLEVLDVVMADSDDAFTTVHNVVVAIALEAVDMSGSAGEDPSGRIKVRIV